MPNLEVTYAVSLDCEMVGAGDRGSISMAARVSVVNEYEQCIYDRFIKPRYQVTDYRTWISGITPKNLACGIPLERVVKEVAPLIRGGILVGHDIGKDLRVLGMCHPEWNIRDTAFYFRTSTKPSLKYLAKEYLGRDIQDGWHSSVIDAKVTMALYKMFEDEWEADSSEYDSD